MKIPFSPYSHAHVESFTVRAYEVDGTGKSSLGTLLNVYNEAAINHAKKLGLDLSDLFPLGLTWVLSRMYIEVMDYPHWREEIFVHTWPAGGSDYFAIRDFEIYSENGNMLARGSSSAMMMDLKNRRGALVADHIRGIVKGDRRSVKYDFPKIPKIEASWQKAGESSLTVRRSDLDINGHVNATQYINWALESVPDVIAKEKKLTSLEITFRAESFHRDNIVSECYVNRDESDYALHRIIRPADKREIARCRSKWQK